MTLTDHVEFMYKADNYYSPNEEGGVRWNDPTLNIQWGVDQPILSDKDSSAMYFKDVENTLTFVLEA